MLISPSADAKRFTDRMSGVHTRIDKMVADAMKLAEGGNLDAAKRQRDEAARQLQIANEALRSDAQNAGQSFQGLPVRIPDDAMLHNAGAAHAHTTARQDISQGVQVGQILDKVRRGIPLTPGEQRVLSTVHPPRRPAVNLTLPTSKPDWITGGDGKPYQVRYVTNPRTGQETA